MEMFCFAPKWTNFGGFVPTPAGRTHLLPGKRIKRLANYARLFVVVLFSKNSSKDDIIEVTLTTSDHS